jgi:DNA-binding transcriptional LysR family regulator
MQDRRMTLSLHSDAGPAMKLHQMRHLVAVAGCGSVRGAARALGVTQSAVTQSLRELEEGHRLALFERRSSGMALTAAGLVLLRHAQLITAQISQAEEEMARLRDTGAVARLSVGVTPWVGQSLLPPVLQAFRNELPQVRLELFEGLSAVAHPRLREGSMDLLIGRVPQGGPDSDLQGTPLFRYEATVVARASHPLAGARSLAELADCDWLLNYTPPEEEALVQRIFLRHGLPVPAGRIHLVHSASLLLHLIAHSDMLSFCPWPLIESGVPQGRIVPLALRETFEPHTVGVVQRGHARLPWAAERFVHHLMEQVHACRHGTDPVLQRVFRSIDVLA